MRGWFSIVLLTLLVSCGGGGGSKPPLIQAVIFSFPPGAAPASMPNAQVLVAEASTGAVITNATVTVNNIPLTFNPQPHHQQFEGMINIAPGEPVNLVVSAGGQTYTASGTQPTSYPQLTQPSSGEIWGSLSMNTVSWSGGSPLAGANYLLGVLDATDTASYSAYYKALSTSNNTHYISPNSLTPNNKEVIIGLVVPSVISGAAINSMLIVGGYDYAPVTVVPGTTPPLKTLDYMDITPFPPSVLKGATLQLNVTGGYSDYSTADLTSQVSWTSSNQTIATIDANGVLTGLNNGSTIITASLDGISTFVTATVYQVLPLEVASVTPAVNATNASQYSEIIVKFNQPLLGDTAAYYAITLTQNGTPVGGTNILHLPHDTASFTPSTPLLPNTLYTATVSGSVQSETGTTMSGPYVWSFTTESALFKQYISVQTAADPEAIAIGDVNGDGRNDVAITTLTSNSIGSDPGNEYKVFVYLQDSAGNLTPPVKYATSGNYFCWGAGIDIGDLNNDGRQDIAVGSSACGIDVLTQAADGTLNPAAHYSTAAANKVRIVDLNKDGLNDLVSAGSRGNNTVNVWMQNTSGTLNTPMQYSVTLTSEIDLEVGDINNDNLIDIVVMSDAWTDPDMEILTQNSNGTFSPHVDYNVGATTNVSSLALGDLNGDNLLDAVVTYANNAQTSRLGIFFQNSVATLNPETLYPSIDLPSAAVVADVNSDGLKDIVVLHHGFSSMGVYEQMTNGTLRSERRYLRPANTSFNPQSLAIGDINGDGQVDAISVDSVLGLVINYHY